MPISATTDHSYLWPTALLPAQDFNFLAAGTTFLLPAVAMLLGGRMCLAQEHGAKLPWYLEVNMNAPHEPRLPLAGLQQLAAAGFWTVSEATTHLGDLQPLQDDLLIIVVVRPIGQFVILGPEGRRSVNFNPHAQISIDAAENRLYLRQAAAHFGWVLTRERYQGAMQDVGLLDQQAMALIDGASVRVVAKCTGDGYCSGVISRLERKLRSTMLSRSERLVVVTPSDRRLRRMDNRNGMLVIVRFPLELARVGVDKCIVPC